MDVCNVMAARYVYVCVANVLLMCANVLLMAARYVYVCVYVGYMCVCVCVCVHVCVD